MSDTILDSTNSTNGLVGGVALLRACQPLVARLLAEGVTITLSKQEEASLLGFGKLKQADYSERDWSYLRMAGGVKVSGVAALNSCLARYEATLDKNR
ncbi:MAG: hypothetical protein WCS37_20485 [Chloroflexota bacterium]|nr:hypothetical protein [Chloroflexota bacterium]